ncbi:toxin-antitoxin system YwqK family antitoxin [Flavihumibacter solisilvae]|uniref:TonB C-terminal domain-containing protein n=1 Tax=Flavihumibacter solisilvae TaxID=1349421 RepID=A0A0C1L7Q7_9BACT|nr:hypothetical protein [Flavihumibacter solisilvae]KIC95596.1 hypothetical protein OI18_04870 [Flavihumibacter solisilvae]
MRLLLILITLFIAAPALAQKSDTSWLSLNEHLAPQKKGGIYPAIVIQQNNRWVLYALQPDTSFVLVMSFLDRKLRTRDGAFAAYQAGKKPLVTGSYRNNLPDSTWSFYDEKGNLLQKGQMSLGQMTGDWTFYTGGRKRSVLHHESQQDTRLPQVTEPANGSLLALNNIRQRMHGPAIFYYPDGAVKDSGAYFNNWMHGEWIHRYENGRLQGSGNYTNDSLTGTWSWFRKDGSQATIEQYRRNKLVSIECFNTEGKPSGNSCPVLQRPYPIGSFTNFSLYAENNLFIPDTLKGVIAHGEVKMRVSISSTGKLVSIKTLSSTHPLLTSEAEAFFHSFTEWSPAIIHNMYADYDVEYELYFTRFKQE